MMENLSKSIQYITTECRFVIPLYQRNYAWKETNVAQLLHDIYENFDTDPTSNYFVGSLIVLKRKDSVYEVIDGQQRLTVFSLLVRYLKPESYTTPFLQYDSREEVNRFLSDYYNGKDIQQYNLTAFMSTIETLKTEPLDARDDKSPSLSALPKEIRDKFIKYIFDKVQIVLVEIPFDTDVASYFEIMNNRGEQLQKHEIFKSYILESIQCNANENINIWRDVYGRLWDACSQMDYRIQSSFKHNQSSQERLKLFGNDYDDLCFEQGARYLYDHSIENSTSLQSLTIDAILSDTGTIAVKTDKDDDEDSDDEDIKQDKSIIDFPNFLMHVLRLKYNECYKDVKEVDLPLNEKELLNVYNVVRWKIDAVDFIKSLLYYRVIFDKYIVRVKATEEEGDPDEAFRWTLQHPTKYEYTDKRGHTTWRINPENTFGSHQDEIVMALSMLQVSQAQRIYKRFLNEILATFDMKTGIQVDQSEYLRRLHSIILETYNSNPEYKSLNDGVPLEDEKAVSFHTNGLRFLFNFIDYLYWTAKKKNITEVPCLNYVADFTFRYNNSIEHHLPQSFKDKASPASIDSLGNLCLISKSANSRLNNEDPVGKANNTGKYYRKDLPPKRKIMYDMTNSAEGGKNWSDREIRQHYEDVQKLIGLRMEILGLNTLDTHDTTTLRALLCIENTSKQRGWVWNTIKYNLLNPSKEAKETILKWKQEHPTSSLEEFINSHLNDQELRACEWRYAFAKYSFILDFCKSRNFGLWDNGKCLIMRGERATEATSRELKHFILFNKLRESFPDTDVKIDAYCVTVYFARTYPFLSDYAHTDDIKNTQLRIWIDYNQPNVPWCYDLQFKRNANSSEVKAFISAGWQKNDANGYYTPLQPYLVNNGRIDLDKSIESASDSVNKLIEQLQHIS